MFDQNIEIDYNSGGGPGGGTYFGLKSFITERRNSVQHQMDSLGICNVTNIENLSANQVYRIYPNPAQEYLNINAETPIKNIKIFDALGQVLYQYSEIPKYQIQLSIQQLNAGIYFLQVNEETKQKFIIVRF